jgi:polyhydroxyalkanoate synthase
VGRRNRNPVAEMTLDPSFAMRSPQQNPEKINLQNQQGELPTAPSTIQRYPYGPNAFGQMVDRSVHAAIARFTFGLSPAALAASYLDWATHLACSPGKQMELVQKWTQKSLRLANHILQCAQGNAADRCIEPLPQDKRFAGPAWQQWPYSLIYQGFLLQQEWWHNATTGVRGVTKQHENDVEFAARARG